MEDGDNYTGYYQPGATAAGSHTHSGPSHRHVVDGHTHSVPAHSHGLNSHTHGMYHYHSYDHSHTIEIPELAISLSGHRHTVDVPAHAHDVSIPTHSHGLTLPSHEHEIKYGIYEGDTANQVTLKVDGNAVPAGELINSEIDIVAYLAKDENGKITRGTWHEIEIVPNGLTRIEASIFVQAFVQSVGGGDY